VNLSAPVDLSTPVGTIPYLLFAADFNQDGMLDLVFGAYTLHLLPGRGDGTFDQEIDCGFALDS
jgi:hypothetical protein